MFRALQCASVRPCGNHEHGKYFSIFAFVYILFLKIFLGAIENQFLWTVDLVKPPLKIYSKLSLQMHHVYVSGTKSI
jgi:hypothetical protein